MAVVEKEIWESTIPGRISVQVENSKGRPQTISVVGVGSRLRIAAEERAIVEEGVRDAQNNPFRNGMLIQVGGPVALVDEGQDVPSTDQNLTNDDLAALFELRDADFEDAVKALSEVNVRRLNGMVKQKDAAKSQVDFLADYISTAWPIGSDTPSNAEARGDRTVQAGQ